MNIMKPQHDSIIDEIHATRERFAEQYQNDLFSYSRVAELHCRELGFHIIEMSHLQSIIKAQQCTQADAAR